MKAEVRRPDLRFPFPEGLADRLSGARVLALTRRAKYLLLETDRQETFILHLGMSGSYRVVADPVLGQNRDNAPTLAQGASSQQRAVSQPGVFYHKRDMIQTHDHLVLDVQDTKDLRSAVIYNDPRRFGFVLVSPTASLHSHPMLSSLGPEPTGNALTADYLAGALSGKRTPLKTALLDQKIIAGLGNIYVCEALNRARLSPRRLAATLVKKNGQPSDRLRALTTIITEVIAEAIAAGGSSLRDYRQTDGSLGYFQHSFGVYDREHAPCPNAGCRGTVQRIVQSGRSTFYCPTCQR